MIHWGGVNFALEIKMRQKSQMAGINKFYFFKVKLGTNFVPVSSPPQPRQCPPPGARERLGNKVRGERENMNYSWGAGWGTLPQMPRGDPSSTNSRPPSAFKLCDPEPKGNFFPEMGIFWVD